MTAFAIFCDVVAVLWALSSLLPSSPGDSLFSRPGFCRGAALAHLVVGLVVAFHG